VTIDLLLFLCRLVSMVRTHVACLLTLAAPLEAAKSQVFHFRHCLRQSENRAKYAKPEFPLLEQYTSQALPAWGVPEVWCTEGGVEAATAAGADLVANFGVDPGNMVISADISKRDGTTAVAMLSGMGASSPINFDAVLYSTNDPEVGNTACAEPDDARKIADRQARFAEVPLPWDLEEAIAEFEDVFGVGVAGSLRELGNVSINSETGKMSGPPVVMKELSQNLLYSRASGIKYLEHATMEQAHRFYAWQAYYRSVMDVNSVKAVESSWLMALTLRDLFGSKGLSSLNLGHDGNMDGIVALLGLLEWEAPPFTGGKLSSKLLPTPPMSALRFVYDDESDTVSASFIYVPYGEDPSAAAFKESSIKTWSRADFMQATQEGLVRTGAEECFSISPYRPPGFGNSTGASLVV
jgi:hypothetical protein